jgi:hypothetical protein
MERHFEFFFWGGAVKQKEKKKTRILKNIYRRFVVSELLDTTPPQKNFFKDKLIA